MARPKSKTTANRNSKLTGRSTAQRVSKQNSSEESVLQRLQRELNLQQSSLSLFLGVLIVVVAGVLLFNYFRKAPEDVGPANQTEKTEITADVSPDALPGKYTVKDGDSLFVIAEKYYQDGYKFDKIAEANKLADVNSLAVGQVLEIPKLEAAQAQQQASPSPSASPDSTMTAQNTSPTKGGVGGAENETIWGEKITGSSYTVQMDDWLSKIAGRAYGDIYAYEKIAKANNLSDPNVLEVGMVLKIPR